MSLSEFFEIVYPLLLNRTLDHVEKELSDCHVKAYWVVNLIRIDIKPKENK